MSSGLTGLFGNTSSPPKDQNMFVGSPNFNGLSKGLATN